MDEAEIEASLESYRTQIQQLEIALQVTEDESTQTELHTLLSDLKQLTQLTEGSLLSLKKSKLMSLIENPSTDYSNNTTPQNSIDAEFAAFQAALCDELDVTGQNNSIVEHYNDNNELSGTGSHADGEEHDLNDIIGNRCRVMYSQEWGEKKLHNAMIVSIEELNPESEPKIRVMFCNPTHKSLLPCPFYLEGRCKFEEDQCRFSHGYVITADDLQEFEEPDHSCLKIESKCLARYSDDLWYPAIVVDILDDHKFQVMFDSYEETEVVSIEDILPGEDGEEDDDEDSASDPRFDPYDSEEDVTPVYLWRPNQTTEKLGDWEKHTKGIGSRLMAKMGYIMGQGLGKSCDGRAEPVPIQLLPPGKSLDKIMELKEKAGDKDLYDVMKKHKRKQKNVDNNASDQYGKAVSRERSTFDFINKRLGGKKGNLDELRRHNLSKEARRDISESELQSKSNKDINIQILKTHEETKNVEKEIKRLKDSIQRNNGRDKGAQKQIQQKLSSMESYLLRLKASEDTMNKQKKLRSDHKKYTVF